jgi:integrase
MAVSPKFAVIQTPHGYMVSVPGNMSSSGNRVRKFFPIATDAEKFAASLRKKYREGRRGGVIPHELAVMAGTAAEILEPHGVTILDAARSFIERMKNTGSSETFAERYDRALLDNEEHWSDRYKLDMERLPRWVGKGFMSKRLCDITTEVIESALRAHGAASQSTLDTRKRYVSAVMNHKTRHRKKTHIEIMTPRQCGQMLRACESPQERRAVALLLFAGIRPSADDGEISRLGWEAVGKSEIFVSREVSKTSDHHIPITPRLRRLLRGHPTEGPVVPANWRRVYKRIRSAVDGIAGKQDITRHTFASHYLAAFGEQATKQAMGHTAGSSTLFRHYRAAVTESAGVRYFR